MEPLTIFFGVVSMLLLCGGYAMYREEVPVGAFTMVFLSFLIVYPEITVLFSNVYAVGVVLGFYIILGYFLLTCMIWSEENVMKLDIALMVMFLWPYEIVKRMLSKNV